MAFIGRGINTVRTVGNQDVAGYKNFKDDYPAISFQSQLMTKGTQPSVETESGIVFFDKDKKQMATIEHIYQPSGQGGAQNWENKLVFGVNRANTSTSTQNAECALAYDVDTGMSWFEVPSSAAENSAVSTVFKTNGYIELGNGLIIQRGTISALETASDTRTVVLPVEMTGKTSYTVMAVAATPKNDSGPITVAPYNRTATGFSLKLSVPSTTTIYWLIVYF